MVQEVQTGVGITNETTLETIEAIGTSSFKIREGRQTTARYTSRATSSGRVDWSYQQSGSRDSGIQSGSLTLDSTEGKAEFIAQNGGIRVPKAGTYQLTIYWSGGSSTTYATIFVKGGGNTLYTKQFTSSDSETVIVNADLGKFDLIELKGQFYYNGSASGAALHLSATITIQQL